MKNLRKIVQSVLCTAVCAAAAVTLSGCTSDTQMIEEQTSQMIEEQSDQMIEDQSSQMIEERPQEYIALSAENTAKSVVSSNFADEYKILEQAAKKGTFSIEFEVEGIRFNGECYVNEKADVSSQHYTLTGSEGTSAGVYVYSDKKLAKIGTEGKSGNHVYDINSETLADKLATSIFAPGSGTAYELDQEDYDMFLELIGEMNSVVTGEVNDAAASYEDMILAYFEEHPPVTEENTETTINGETVEANIFRYDIPKDDIYSLIDQLVDEALKDQMNFITAEGVTMEEAKADIMSDLDEYEDYSANLVYYINSKTNELMQLDMKLRLAEKQPDEDDDLYYYYYGNAVYDISMSMVYGIDPANAEKQSFVMEIDVDYYDNEYYDDDSMAISADITNSENKTEIVIDVTENGKSDGTLYIVSERDGENYTITISADDGTSIKIEGTLVTDSSSFTMTIDRIALTDGSAEVAYAPKAVISVKAGGEALALKADKEFLDITESELDDLFENIVADFKAVFEEVNEDSVLNYLI